MKVILKQDVKGVGVAGAVVDVAAGYGRNFLLPRGIAQEATPANLAQIDRQKASKQRRDAKAEAEAKATAVLLESRPVNVSVKSGEGNRLFGSVTNAQIAAAIKSDFGVEVDRHKVEPAEPIKTVGDHHCAVKLVGGITARVVVRVTGHV